MRVHSALPDPLTAAIDAALRDVEHVAHGCADPMRAAEAAAGDADAIALIGPFRSREVAEVVVATAPAGLPLLAPVATWAGITRADEPGCEDDPANHRGTVLRMLARDTDVAAGALRTDGRLLLDLGRWLLHGRAADWIAAAREPVDPHAATSVAPPG